MDLYLSVGASQNLGLKVQRLSKVLAKTDDDERRDEDPEPVRNDPEDKEGLEVVVGDGASGSTAKDLLESVQHGLGEGHDYCEEANDRGRGPVGNVRQVDIGEIENGLDDVEEGLCVCESMTTFKSRKTVDIVNVLVKTVGFPDPVQVTAYHGAGAHEAIGDIPENDRGCN